MMAPLGKLAGGAGRSGDDDGHIHNGLSGLFFHFDSTP